MKDRKIFVAIFGGLLIGRLSTHYLCPSLSWPYPQVLGIVVGALSAMLIQLFLEKNYK